jgi:hypothetical protein
MARFSKAELEAEGLTDFRVFLCHVWAFLGLPPPTRVQLDIAWYLQHGPRRKMIEAFRGVGKSWITVAFVLWTLLLNPQAKVMVVSAGEKLAGDFTRFCKQLIHGMPLLQHLAPRDDQSNSALAFDVGPATPSKDPSVKSVGITGQLTGSRADLIVADDIETPKNSYTHLLRERLAELVKEFDAVLKPEGRVVYLGTPQIETSLYNRLWKDRGYDVRIWPAEIPADTSKYAGKVAPLILKMIAEGMRAGAPTDPKRFAEEDLLERRASYGAAGYALQFQLDTSPSDADRYPLKLRDLVVHDCDPDLAHVNMVWGGGNDLVIQDLAPGGIEGDRYHRPAWKSPEMAKYTATVMAIDPSGKGKDETAYAVVKYAHGYLYLVASGGFVDGYGEETLSQIANIAVRHRVNDVVIETNYGGGMFNQLLKPHLIRVAGNVKALDPALGGDPAAHSCRIDEEWNGWSTGQKELRILDTLSPIFQNHKLIVDRRVIEADLKVQQEDPRYSLVQQMTRISRIKNALPNEDRLEALSMACSYFVEKMSRDEKKVLQQHRTKLMDQELKRFMQHALGGKPRRRTWV